ncbi:MAG: TIGR03619 family F420-dependent LLM class oxidoreductase [Mycobacteriales bacterium]
MQIGFGVPVSGSWATRENMAHVARRAEDLGYHSLWTFQRLLHPTGHDWGPMYRSVVDPLVTLGYLAAVTTRPRLGVAVVNMPFVTPIYLAKQAATLDELSGGRLDLGLGLGWAPEEFQASGVDLAHRGRRAEEFLDCLFAIWAGEEFAGEFYTMPAARCDPPPVQRPHPPVLLGGMAEVALRRAGRLADGWVSSSRADLTAIGGQIDVVREAAREAGRDPAALRFVVRGVVALGPAGGADRAPLSGSAEEIRRDLAALAAHGVTEVFLDLNFNPRVGSPDADPAASVRHAEEVLETFAPAAIGA